MTETETQTVDLSQVQQWLNEDHGPLCSDCHSDSLTALEIQYYDEFESTDAHTQFAEVECDSCGTTAEIPIIEDSFNK